MVLSYRALLLLLLMSAVGWTRPASADIMHSEHTLERFSGQVGLRYGSSGLNIGLGARAGYVLPPGIYLGGLVDYYFGGSYEVLAEQQNAIVSQKFWLMAAEVGYDLQPSKRLVARPLVYFGILGGGRDVCVGEECASQSASFTIFGVGGHLLYLLSPTFAVGGELRLRFGDLDGYVLGINASIRL